ncbi:MAG: class II aldolase/adducin family protein [Polyangiaceae bacterium]
MRRLPETALRQALIRFAKLCHEQRLLVAMDGNLSVRLAPDLILCTRAGCHKGLLQDEDLVVIDLQGRRVRGRGDPTSEMPMHLACYRARPDIEAVVHAHPPTCIAFTVAGVSMAQCVLPEAVLTIGAIPTLDYERTGTDALAASVGEAVRSHDAVMMDRHGAVCVGTSLLEAYCKLETMEHTAKVLLAARQLGAVRELPAAEAAELRALGLARYGGPPAAMPSHCANCSGCGKPSAAGLGAPAGFSVARLTRPATA